MVRKPNVLILLTDQQRYDTIRYAGNPHMITPNLDRLASEGCLYTHAHTTNPICMAARHDLLTGLPGRAHGIFGNTYAPIKDYRLPTLPRIFSENGYRTAAIGKMHFFPPRMHHGYNEMFLMEELPRCRQDDQYAQYLHNAGLGHVQNIHGVRPHIYHLPQNSQMDDEHHGTAWVADQTINWLKNNDGHPFMVFASWIHPHPPFALPKSFQGLYRGREIPLPIPVSREYPFNTELSEWHGDMEPEAEKRRIREAYFSCITHVDHHIGRLLDYLEQSWQMDHTLILFASDHGEMLQDKGYYGKMLPYEGSVRIPFIVRCPWKVKPGSVNGEFVDLFDIMPTCLEACGLEYNGEAYKLPGESLFSASPQRDRSRQISSYSTGAERWLMCRNKRYKYIYKYNRGIEEMYDLWHDPQELSNLVRAAEIPRPDYEMLKAEVLRYEKQWGPEPSDGFEALHKIDGTPKQPAAASKFALSSNGQAQKFDTRSGVERGEAFLKELEYALTFDGAQEPHMNEVCNHPLWKENMIKHFEQYAPGFDIESKLFKS